MDEGKGWLRTNWRTAVVLVLIFGLALFLRIYFVYGLAFHLPNVNCDSVYTPPYSGGSDSFYWDRALCYSFQSGRDLGTDPMLNYPLGSPNPRPPLFPWFSLLVGHLLAPFFADGWQAVQFTFLLSTGLFGALTVFPAYALGKEAFGRKAGIIGALLLAISVGHLQRSASTDADHDAFTLFFVVSTFYFFLRGLRTLNRKRWVENWFRKDAIVTGLRSFFKENRTSVLYALLAGLCVSVIALAWQGWAYVAVILMVWFGAELFLDRLRNEDTMGTWILFSIALGLAILLAFQWYFVRAQIRVWFDVPVYLYLAAVVLGLAFTVTRDYPWTLVIPSTLIAAAVGLGVGVLVNPTITNAFFTGAGYFIQSKVVSTIAEDQAPGMSQMILSFGLFTFGMTLVAIAYLLWQIPKRRDPSYTLVVVWAFTAIFMAITAARFIFNASPAFAIVAGFAVDQILRRADFATMRRTYHSLAAGSWRNAFRKSVKVRHILAILGIVFLVLLPNVWWAVDASIPFELKTQYERQIGALLPTFLQSPGYNPASGTPYYFGAFGYSLPKPTEYYPAAWNWFATQDTGQPPELRPAFLSWWDYGFEAVDRGAHPTVADNFQNGFALAGQFLTAQNETEAISLLVIRLLEGDLRRHRPNFSPAVEASLEGAGLPVDVFLSVMLHPADYISTVLSDPVRYGSWAADMQPLNAQYIFLSRLLGLRLNTEGVVSLYKGLRDATGSEIGYFAVDSRLFPISVQNTGIFYAPVKLSDHRILQLPDGRVLPFEFFQVLATTNRGSNIPIQFVPPGDQIQSQAIKYLAPFYNSMFYRAYVGYSPADLGSNDTGIPGLDQALSAFPPVPAWNLTHFRVVYRTAYYNPFNDPSNHTDAWGAVNYDQGQRLQENITAGTIHGVVDQNTQTSLANGVVFLRYYDGAWVNGTVSAGSTPLPGVTITVADELRTPHYLTHTDASGHYSALVPFGDVTITASVGTLTKSTLIGARTLADTKVHVTIDQAMRSPADADGDTLPDWIMTRDLAVAPHVSLGVAFYDFNRNGGFDAGDGRASGATITLRNKEFGYSRTGLASSDGTYGIEDLTEGSYAVGISLNGRALTASDITIAFTDQPHDVLVPFAMVQGLTLSNQGAAIPAANVEFADETNSTIIAVSSESDGSYRVGPLLAGNYTVTASSGEFASTPNRIRTTNADLRLNLTLSPSGTVTGATKLFGNVQPFASLEFQSAVNPRLVRTVTSLGNAQYSLRLEAGDWFVNGRFYNANRLYATLGQVLVSAGGTTHFDAMFLDGVRLEGTVKDPNPAVRDPQADIAFASPSGQLWLRTDGQGGYLAFLPADSYDLEAFNRVGAAFERVTLSSSVTRDITLINSPQSVSWRVYRDINGDGALNPGEEIAGAHIEFADETGARLFLTSRGAGEILTPLFANRTYSGTVSATGYATRSIPASSPTDLRTFIPVVLAALPVQIQGTVLLNGSPLVNRPVTIRAVPSGNGAAAATTLSDSNGGYSFAIVPGTYSLAVDENVSTSRDLRYQNLMPDPIALTVGQGSLSYDLRIVARSRVQGNVTLAGAATDASLTFAGPDRTTINATAAGYEVYLIPGSYVVMANRTVASRDYAFVSGATVPSAVNLSFAFANATRATGRALFNGEAVPGPMPVSFARLEGGAVSVVTDGAGAYSAILAPGNYSVSLSGTRSTTEGGAPRYYLYTFFGNVTISPGQTILLLDLIASRTLDNTTVSGQATTGGQGVGATVLFTARGGGAISTLASTDSSGTYSVALAPGTYDVYAKRSVGSSAFLARITVPHAASLARDLPLAEGFLLSGVTTNVQGSGTSATVSIESTAQLNVTSDASGAYQVLLPGGVYKVTATKAGTENGVAVTYRATTSVTLQSDSVANLALAKVESRTASLTWDTSQRRLIAGGDFVTYSFAIRNTGNVADTFTFSATPQDWQFSFSPSSVPLNFGTGATPATVQVVIQTPPFSFVDHGAIRIVAASATTGAPVGNVLAQLDILRVRGLSVTVDPTGGTFDGRFLNYTLRVMNSGNAAETIHIGPSNPTDLAAAGWSVTLATADGRTSGATLTNLTIQANRTVQIRLQAQSTAGSSGATVVLLAVADDAPAVSSTAVFALQLPDLAPGSITVTGPEITGVAPVNLQLVAIVTGAIAAVGAGLFLSRRRR